MDYRKLNMCMITQKDAYPLPQMDDVTIKTNHSSLQWLLDTKELEERMARWIQELGAYEFQVEHCPGKRHGNQMCS